MWVDFTMSLTKKTTTGIIWSFAEQLSKRGISIVVTLLLARFLIPSDYGLIGMMAVFIAVANSLMDSGFKEALIRKEDATQTDFNTVFYANIALGLLSYVLLFISAPIIASFYEEPRLILLIRVVSIVILINAFQVVQSACLSRNLNFKAQLQVSIPATIISGLIAVIMAFKGFGVWSLITQMIVSAFLITVFLWSMKLWRPTMEVSQRSLAEMFGFGSKLFLSGLINTVFLNVYIIVIAKIFTATIAGHYYFAKSIKNMILNQFVMSIQKVTYPALATLQNNDDTLKVGYRRLIRVTTFLLFPAMAFLSALADPIFNVFLNEKWLPAVPYLQLMCIAGIMYPLHSMNLNILKVKGRSDLFLYLEVIKKIVAIIILYLSIPFGVIGILLGEIASSLITYIPNSYFSYKLIGYSVREQIDDFLPCLLLSGVIAGTVYIAVLLSNLSALIELILFGTLSVTLYLLGAHILKLRALILTLQTVNKYLNSWRRIQCDKPKK